jgi:hypothetical protein
MHRYWFKPKRHGFGAVPATWEGWAAAAAAVLCLLIETRLIAGQAPVLLAQALTVAGFFVLCWAKTEGGWRWRWGEDR